MVLNIMMCTCFPGDLQLHLIMTFMEVVQFGKCN